MKNKCKGSGTIYRDAPRKYDEDYDDGYVSCPNCKRRLKLRLATGTWEENLNGVKPWFYFPTHGTGA